MSKLYPNGQTLDAYEPLLLSTKEHFDTYWSATKPLLTKCVDRAAHGEYTVDDIYNAALQSKAFIFIVKSDKTIVKSVIFALVLEMGGYPRLPSLNILAIGGMDLDALHEKYWKQLCGWAYMNGARVLEGMVSPAMQRVIARYGFKPVYTQMRLDLSEIVK